MGALLYKIGRNKSASQKVNNDFQSQKGFFSLKVVLLTLEILDFVNKVEKCYYNVPRNFGVNMKSNCRDIGKNVIFAHFPDLDFYCH